LVSMQVNQFKEQSVKEFDAYLDIETTGLSQNDCYITVIGIYLCNGRESSVVQIYGRQISGENLLRILQGVRKIYTYNGKRFDLPFINSFLGIDLELQFEHEDLMFRCWECNLKGGLKAVERQLGIYRESQDVDGLYAVWLWNKYIDENDEEALERLLRYNRDDIVNLKTLREKLGG
jgi:uncharacterized protein YprB with RNaseH-like and TPR domain